MGKKYIRIKILFNKVLQPCINKYAKWYNFSPNSKWEKKESVYNYKYPKLKAKLRNAIDMAIENADSFDEFVHNLNEQGINTRIGKHISLCIPGQKKQFAVIILEIIIQELENTFLYAFRVKKSNSQS